MKKRILSAFVGLLILSFVFIFYKTIIFNFAVSFIALMAVYELLLTTKYLQNKSVTAICFIFTFLVPFLRTSIVKHLVFPICYIFILILFIIMLFHDYKIKLEQVAVTFFISFMVSFSLSTLVYIRDFFAKNYLFGILYSLLIFSGAWMTDTGGYFVGMMFGKSKLVPKISPKKTLEGALGGVIISIFSSFLILMIMQRVIYKFNMTTLKISYLRFFLVTPLASLIGMVGDLSASMIKRQFLIKDFGDIMPGHGGVVDRFDSIFFVSPFYYIVALFLPIVC